MPPPVYNTTVLWRWFQRQSEKRQARTSALAAEADLDRLELDLMESDEDDAVELPADRYQYRIATTFPHAGDEEQQMRGGFLYYQWQREKY